MTNIEIRRLYPFEGMILGVLFGDGSFKKYEVSAMAAKYPIFKRLEDGKLFKKAKIDSDAYGVTWAHGINISARELYARGKVWEDGPKEDILLTGLISGFIKERRRRGITQQELSEKTGISQPVIARMENYTCDTQLSTLLKLMDSVGLSLKIVKDTKNSRRK